MSWRITHVTICCWNFGNYSLVIYWRGLPVRRSRNGCFALYIKLNHWAQVCEYVPSAIYQSFISPFHCSLSPIKTSLTFDLLLAMLNVTSRVRLKAISFHAGAEWLSISVPSRPRSLQPLLSFPSYSPRESGLITSAAEKERKKRNWDWFYLDSCFNMRRLLSLFLCSQVGSGKLVSIQRVPIN